MVPGRDIVCIGASAGGLQPLKELIRALPADLAAALCVVVHRSAETPGVLPQLLRNASVLDVEVPRDQQAIQRGTIYVAPPDYHLLVKRQRMRVVRGPREHSFRPAVDPLFRTAAHAYGPRVIGVVLSGGMNDGTSGLLAIKRAGGVTIVQDPSDADVPQMPLSAIANVEVDHVLEPRAIASTLERLASEPLGEAERRRVPEVDGRPDPAEFVIDALQNAAFDDPPSAYTCPECGGTLWEVGTDALLEFRCHFGHKYAAESLLAAKTTGLDSALWTALRSLEEDVSLRRRIGKHAEEGWPPLAESHEHRANESERYAALLRRLLLEDRDGTLDMSSDPETRAKPRRAAAGRSFHDRGRVSLRSAKR